MSKTILLADDSLTIQKVVELTFSDTDFKVIATSSGDELLTALPSSGADIIICDTIMPGTDGYSVCQAIKSESNTLHLPVILMTGTFEPFDRDRALAAGCSEIITKPFEARNLVETVERLVSESIAGAPAPEAFAGSVAPPTHDGSITPPPLQPPADAPSSDSEFGTMLSPPAENAGIVDAVDSREGLDFTSTGFAEMEAAGSEPDSLTEVVPDDGIEFEPATPIEPPIDNEQEETEKAKPAESESTQPIPAADLAEAVDPFEAATAGMFAQPVVEPEIQPVVEEVPDEAVEVVPPDSGEGPFESPQTEEEPLELPEVDARPDTDSLADTGPLEDPSPMTEVEPEIVAETVSEVEPAAEPEPEIEAFSDQGGTIEDMAETPTGRLSDDDIDRIARKVVELAGDRLEKIAWDVIPDMAEIVVRERLRELEDDIERAAGSTEPN